MAKELPQIAEEIVVIGSRIMRRVTSDLSQASEVSRAQIFVIMLLFHQGPLRMSDIVKEWCVAAPTVTGILNRLETAGHIKRTADKADRRAVVVELTTEGQKLALKLRGQVVERWVAILSKIPAADADKYLEILKKINEAL